MASSTATKFLGKGLNFPIIINGSGRADLVEGKELLESSLRHILSWAIGTRYFLAEFGSNLEQLLQEPNDQISRALVKNYTTDVISQWDKRIDLLDVTILNKNDNSMNLFITYRIKQTKIEDSFIFPYYSQIKY